MTDHYDEMRVAPDPSLAEASATAFARTHGERLSG